jgi:hypothetical protein
MLTREKLLSSFERRYEDVPTVIGTLRIRNLTEGEKSDFEAGSLTADGKLNLKYHQGQRRRLCALTLVDDKGELLLTKPGDVERLKDVDASVTGAVFSKAMEHCGFSRDEQKELEKNCDEAPADDSPTV